MKKMTWSAGLLLAGALSVSPAVAQSTITNSDIPSTTSLDRNTGLATQELLTYTVHEAWIQSGRNEDRFFAMVKQLAEMSAQKRGVSLPETEAAGRKMGNLIKDSSRNDPDQLLYAVVDTALRQTVGTGGHPASGN